MSGIGSTLRRHRIEVAWGAFALANVAVILLLFQWETIPFHLIWVSLTLLYGYRVWRLRTTATLLAVVVAVTGAAFAWSVIRAAEGFDEVGEVPLMAAMFLAMVWHARRRQAAVEEARRRAEREHRMLERQREFVRDASHGLRTPITVPGDTPSSFERLRPTLRRSRTRRSCSTSWSASRACRSGC